MNPPDNGNPFGGHAGSLFGMSPMYSAEEMYRNLKAALDMEENEAQLPPPPPQQQQQYHPPLEEAFANMGISATDSTYNRSSFSEFQHYPLLSDRDPAGLMGPGEHTAAPHSVARSAVGRDAALAYSSNPMIINGYCHSGLLGHQAQPALSNHGFLSSNLWRNWHQDLSSSLYGCREPFCVQCNDLFTLATNPRTSKEMQSRIRTMNRAQIGRLFSEFMNKIERMMNHPSPNFISLILLEVFTKEQIDQILRKLCSKGSTLSRLCIDNNGRRAVQKLLERLTEPSQRALLTRTLKPYVLQLVKNEEGRFVIIFCLTNFGDEENKLVLEEVARNCCEIGRNKKGYDVLTCIISSFKGQDHENSVLREIVANAVDLAYDQYGNYVVQELLKLEYQNIKCGILDQLEGHFYHLSLDKFGSNVVEECLRQAPRVGRLEGIILELLGTPYSSSLFLNNYGNYVMQTALQVSQNSGSPIHQALLLHLQMNEARLQSARYGKQLLKWLHPRTIPNRN